MDAFEFVRKKVGTPRRRGRKPRNLKVDRTPKLARAEALVREQLARWNLAGWEFRFNNRKRAMGLCVYPAGGVAGRIELSRHFVEGNEEAEVLDTILHEVAHALAGEGTGHGPRWQEWCLKVGARPVRCGSANMPAGKWQAACPACGKLYFWHRKPKYRTGYYCRLCGKDRGLLTPTTPPA